MGRSLLIMVQIGSRKLDREWMRGVASGIICTLYIVIWYALVRFLEFVKSDELRTFSLA